MDEERLISPELNDINEERLENSLRPKTLNEYIGQDKVKENMYFYMALLDLEKQHLQILYQTK